MSTLLLFLALSSTPLVSERSIELPKSGGFDALAYDADNRRILAAHSGAGTLTVLDVRIGKVVEVETGSINGIAVSKRLDRYFVAGGNKELVALSRKTLKVLQRVPLSDPADLVEVDPSRNEVIVCKDDGTEDWVFDASTLKSVGVVAIEEAPEFLQYDPPTNLVYQNIKSTDHLQVIDVKKRKVVATWNTTPMKSPHGLILDSSRGFVYSAGRNGKLVVFSLASGKQTATIDIAPGTDQIAIDTKLGRLYCPGRDKMTVVSTVDNRVIGELDLPAGTKNLAVDTHTHSVWISVSDAKGARLMSFKATK